MKLKHSPTGKFCLMMEEGEIIEPYELNFSDLVLLSSVEPPLSSLQLPAEEIQRLQAITNSIMENLGPRGPGLVAISGVPKASILRRKLLPLARKLALLNFEHRKLVLKEHGLGSDVPLKNLDRTVSPFAMQLKYLQASDESVLESNSQETEHCYLDIDREEGQNCEFHNLERIFKELGFCMMELGLCLARICDKFIGGHELEESLLESRTAKGRLIHYHSSLDNLILKQDAKRKESSKKPNSNAQPTRSNLWQQWHYDYGIFTILTAPMFMLPCDLQSTANECDSPSGHSYLQIYYPNKNRVVKVKSSPQSFIVQVGESADVLSKGKLRSTLHSVCKPEVENLSRETFVVFLQPAWSKTFSLLDYPIEKSNSFGQLCCEVEELTQDIDKIVPPFSARLRDGMTFAQFSRETTKQYYGDSGLQSKRERK